MLVQYKDEFKRRLNNEIYGTKLMLSIAAKNIQKIAEEKDPEKVLFDFYSEVCCYRQYLYDSDEHLENKVKRFMDMIDFGKFYIGFEDDRQLFFRNEHTELEENFIEKCNEYLGKLSKEELRRRLFKF